MAGPQRKCANCRYFQDAGMPGNGWCTHPKRQLSSDVKILVRSGELACRNSWGGDLFQSGRDNDSSATETNADLPGGDRDDEVTSVITPPDRQPSAPAEDRVVSDRPARHRDDDDRNEAARLDQDERARIMARGSRDALRHARERHTNRQQTSSRNPDSDDDTSDHDGHAGGDERVVTHRARFSDRFLTPRPASAERFNDGHVPRAEVERRFSAAHASERFETVPEVDPNFDLPGLRRRDDAIDNPPVESLQAADPVPEEGTTSYEHVLNRARRIRESKTRKAMRPLRHADLRLGSSEPESGWDAGSVDDVPVETGEARTDRSTSDPEPVDDKPNMDVGATDLADLDDAWQGDESVDRWDDPEDVEYDDDRWQAGAADDAWDDLPYDDASPERPPSRRGWLSSLRFRRRTPSLAHDDATVTRHASMDETWDDDAGSIDPGSWAEDWQDDSDQEPTVETAATWWDDTDEEPNEFWADEQATGEDHRTRHRWLPSGTDTTFAGTESANRLEPEFFEDRHDPEPFEPGPAERVAERVAPQSDTWHRRRQATHLPDLDDNLFEATFERNRPSPESHVADRLATGHTAGAQVAILEEDEHDPLDSPRESYFRAARFRDWAEEQSGANSTRHRADAATETPRRLPDLDEHGFNLKELVARGGEVLDMTIDIAPEIPRECRTCRSFRSAEGGARGWCTNEWAFTHRRMVNEDDLACDSSIGCWWLPADKYLIAEDDDGYAAATPRMDELIARLSGLPDRREISGA